MLALLSSSTAKLVVILVIVAALMGSGAALMHKLDANKYTSLELQYAKAQDAAVAAAMTRQHQYDADAIAAAEAERDKQTTLATELQGHQQEVVRYVPVIQSCVPYGLVRVLRAAAIGVPAGNVSLPAGKSDGACTSLKWPALAGAIVSDFGTARANAIQLNALIDFMRKTQAEAK
jgi:hypothetical protein